MTGLRFLAALAALPWIGYPFARLGVFAALSRGARWGLAGALGALLLCVEMVLASALGVPWSLGLLLTPPVLAALLLALRTRRVAELPEPRPAPGPVVLAGLAATLAVVAYAAATARATAADFVLFWAAKGQRFGHARGIDVAFLRDPAHVLMHPDYPPMLPCLYAWATMAAGRFAWGAALLAMPLFLTLSALTLYGFAHPVLGRRRAAEYAGLLSALLGFLMVADMVAGDAEPVLFLFEVLTLSALTFSGGNRAGIAAAAVGLTGAVLTKIEGTVFAGLVVLAYAPFAARGRRSRTAAALAVPPAAALLGWLAFCWRNGLLEIYRAAGHPPISLARVPTIAVGVAREGLSGLRAAACAAVAILLLSAWPGRSRRTAAAAAVAAGFVGFMLYMYSTIRTDPALWIQWSAARLLLTPLLCLMFAGIAGEGEISNPLKYKG